MFENVGVTEIMNYETVVDRECRRIVFTVVELENF